MEKSVQITLIIATAVIILGLIGYTMFCQSTGGPRINANGVATVFAEPDLVSVYFNIQTEANTAKEAKDENAEIVNAVTTALVIEGLERKDITTQNFNVHENWEWNGKTREQNGWQATHSLRDTLYILKAHDNTFQAVQRIRLESP